MTKKNDLSRSDILKSFHHTYAKWAKPREIYDQGIIKDLVNFEEQLVCPLSFLFFLLSLIDPF